jgi:predicted dehydrogenase
VQDWWPPGHVTGWSDTFVKELAHMLDCIASDTQPSPSFEDGYRCSEVLDAIERGGTQQIVYR